MSRRARLVVLTVGAVGFALLWTLAALRAPGVGGDAHPYRDAAVAAAVSHATANVVSSINFDVRALDTLGEETILLASVVAAVTLLRPAGDERVRLPDPAPSVLPATRLAGWVLLPVTVLVGIDVVVHGHLTPGGGFQGGVVLATAVHLLYLAGSFEGLQRLRPNAWAPIVEPVGAAAFLLLGVAGLVVVPGGAGLLANVLPFGTLGAPDSAGTVALLSTAIGLAVGAGAVALLAAFLRQEIVLGPAAGEGER